MRRFLIYTVPIVAYMALVFALSAKPMPEEMPDYWQIDKLYHFFVYLVMGLLWARAIHNGRAGRPGFRVLATAVLITVSFGALVEVYQSLLPYRSGDIIDAVANGLGGLAGVAVFARVKRMATQSTGGLF